eukprot:TRINITY_DN12827_c0_g1_i1.p1 TRINITY_DN12827_c0_g1~~TRINITY_DN12827_c0_g1_i1.p1  ORF type:complete len:292 (+),score=91.17 TRINITY_DN12827_c0_g1_i1:71-946(+)
MCDGNTRQFSTDSFVDEAGVATPTCIPTVPHFQEMDRRDYVKQVRRGKVETRLHDLSTLFRKYDFNQDGVLERDEVHQLLRDLGGGLPTLCDDEIDYVMRAADANMNAVIDEEEIPKVVQLWEGYLEHQEELEGIMQRYDTNKDGVLSRQELKAMLCDLKGGCEVASDYEVDRVMLAADVSRTGFLTPREAVFALSYHYSYDDKPAPLVPGQSSHPNSKTTRNAQRGGNASSKNRAAANAATTRAKAGRGSSGGGLADAAVSEVARLFVLHKAGALTKEEFHRARDQAVRL